MSFLSIEGALIFKVEGRDCPRYLNARLSNDIKNLEIGNACVAAALNPQGRTQALFRVYRIDTLSFTLTCDGGNGDEVLAALKQYIVADRVVVHDVSNTFKLLHLIPQQTNLHCLEVSATPWQTFLSDPGETAPAHLPATNNTFASRANILVARNSRTRKIGFDLIGPREDLLKIIHSFTSLGEPEIPTSEYEYERMIAGSVAFPQELGGDYLFSESGLVTAVSFKKGCYVGQEVVEKIDSHGKAPYRLVRIRFPFEATIQSGDEVHSPGNSRATGEILSIAHAPDNREVVSFARLRNDGSWSPGSTVMAREIKGEIFE